MGLSEICDIDLKEEQKSIDMLFQSVDRFESVVFNSGAGSGKTYALIECLKYIVENNRENLNNHNQKIACITYTNVAAENIKQQLGSSDVVEVSTIHDRIWNVICNQKAALLSLHIEKLNKEVKDIEFKLNGDSDYKKYRELDADTQRHFFELMEKNKKQYNSAYNLNAAGFREAMPEEIRLNYSDLLSSVAKFKGLVDKLFRKKRYIDCIKKIENGEKGYKEVNYDAMYNRDRLVKMRISHDTLLQYGHDLVEKYPKMKQIIIDRYPYILIDEYQDTADIVVEMMNIIEDYAKKIEHNIFIAYFGDSVQNIYDTGVGSRLKQLHIGLKDVTKIYNRRSYTEIINSANKIRNDKIEQKSIYKDCKGGAVNLYFGNEYDVNGFIQKFREEWDIQIDNPLHCLFATNQMVADYSGFLNVYEAFKGADVYQGIGYKQLNSELFSHDTVHLGDVQAILFRMMTLYVKVRVDEQPLREILPTNEYRNMSFSELKVLVDLLQSIDGCTLKELLIHIFEYYNSNNMYRFIIDRIFDFDEDTSYNEVVRYFANSLYNNWDESVKAEDLIDSLLIVEVKELLNWFAYVNRSEEKEVCYHTFHSTKGLEYENVVIILGKDFGVNRGLFETFFKEYGKNDEMLSSKYIKGRNILYVAVTRAIKNLSILYIDEVEQIKGNMEVIFGKGHRYVGKEEVRELL